MKRLATSLAGMASVVALGIGGISGISAPAFAQGAGTPIQGTLGADSPRDGRPYGTRTLTLKAGQRYVITADSEDFDPMLELYAPDADMSDDDNAVAQDDDSGEGNGAAIEYTPERSGQYKLRIKAVDSDLGRYTLRIRELPPLPAPTRATPVSTSTMTVRVFSGELTASDPEVQNKRVDDYLIRLEGGKPAIISMDRDRNNDDLDPALALFQGERNTGNPVETDDDGGSGVNAMIVFTPEATGNYVIRATSTGDRGKGKYTLRVAQ